MHIRDAVHPDDVGRAIVALMFAAAAAGFLHHLLDGLALLPMVLVAGAVATAVGIATHLLFEP